MNSKHIITDNDTELQSNLENLNQILNQYKQKIVIDCTANYEIAKNWYKKLFKNHN